MASSKQWHSLYLKECDVNDDLRKKLEAIEEIVCPQDEEASGDG